ncbi:hypothetical protein [Medusavirus stheno T3]|uniref:Uncharacterized protein n=1 Tax=Medusavirus stheno T3 TaxID=3069717 RepID=A0A7S7YG03_9VIRU|nr:hypothetical protein QKU73_gp348 [Acanthamoeba castellanii medusavirus]QPB44427.1 hypothetical protein [Medusavirus stheno T3]
MNASHLLLLAMLASACVAASAAPGESNKDIKTRTIGNPFIYGQSFMLRRNSNPTANCLRQSNVTGLPINCDSSYSDLTSFIITGPTVTASTTALSPTTSASLAPSGTTSPSTQWCFPKNSTDFSSPFTILCNGASTFPWFQLVKTGGVYGDGTRPLFALPRVCGILIFSVTRPVLRR